jgi:hypothetical protein
MKQRYKQGEIKGQSIIMRSLNAYNLFFGNIAVVMISVKVLAQMQLLWTTVQVGTEHRGW